MVAVSGRVKIYLDDGFESTEVTLDSENYLILRESDVLAVIS